MNIRFLLTLDRLIGPLLLWVLPPIVGLLSLVLLPRHKEHALPVLSAKSKKCVFLKLKGGGSLIIALPSLLVMRKATPQAKFILVCTMETKVYAELTGIFDDYAVIQDNNFFRLITTALASLAKAFGADHCIDLEPNSLLSAVFSLLTMSTHRLGLVKPEDQFRSSAYTQSLSFNIYAPIHLYYDNMAKMLTGNDAILSEARDQFSLRISQLGKSADMPTFCLAPFTSDFAPERRMPAFVWAHFLRQRFPKQQIRLVLLGSQKDKSEAQNFISELKMQLPYMIVEEKCGQYTLQKTASTLMASHEVWAIDSGLLHIARLLGVPCTSFWGPTNPNQRLRTIDGLKETVHYKAFACSPCTHIIGDIPCGGNNLCMTIMAEPNPNRAPLWLVE